MDRRLFIKSAGLLTATALVAPRFAQAAANAFTPSPSNGWRLFEITTRIELPRAESATRVWVPLPSITEAQWIKPIGNHWEGNAAAISLERDPRYGAEMLMASWKAGEAAPVLEVKSLFSTLDRAIDFSKPGKVAALDAASARLYTQPTALLPTDGLVKATALEITKGAKTDLDKARAIYEWVVDNTQRNPKTKGCGVGDIRGMLETGDLSGKCADLNALYVGLARAAGLPARDVYGIRVANSKYGYASLGKAGVITKAQHCRAEVWLSGFGWVPVDPADVRKVVLEEKPGLTLADEVVVAARQTLFGAWEMNWLAYNDAHDIKLPGSKGATLPFLMYPQGENAEGRFNTLDPDNFRYTISSREILV